MEHSQESYDNILGKHIQMLRKERKITQQDMADKLGVLRQTYSHYETGRIKPTLDTLIRISSIFHVPLSSFSDYVTVPPQVQAPQNINIDLYLSEKEKEIFTSQYIEFCNRNDNVKRLKGLNRGEKRILFYYDKLTESEREDIMTQLELTYRRKLRHQT